MAQENKVQVLVFCVFSCVNFLFFSPTPLFEPRYYKHRKDFPIYVWSTKGHSLEEFLTLGTTQLFASKNSSKYYQTEKKKKNRSACRTGSTDTTKAQFTI